VRPRALAITLELPLIVDADRCALVMSIQAYNWELALPKIKPLYERPLLPV
jgi:hypothetical protein